MALIDEIKAAAQTLGLDVKDSGKKIELQKVIAERKAFLSSKKLEYHGKIILDDAKKALTFSEYLKESGFGMSSGDSDMSAGFGFSAGTYSTGMGGRSGSIKEQSDLFGKKYQYEFKYEEIREKIEEVAKAGGYTFEYKIL